MMKNKTISEVWEEYKSWCVGKSGIGRPVVMTFAVVACALLWTARKLHLTYKAINVLAYYWLAPATWTFMIDWWLDCQISTPIYSGFVPLLTGLLCSAWAGIIVAVAPFFNKWCDLTFSLSVGFLCFFNRWGGNYVLNSVVICVVVPIIIYVLLFLLFL